MDGSVLNIYDSKQWEYDAKYAISQVWTSIATKQQISDYQAASSDERKPLSTYLSGEAIRTDDRKYVNYYQQDGSVVRNDIVGEDVNDLKKILVEYNAFRVATGNELPSIEAKIRHELRNLGYEV